MRKRNARSRVFFPWERRRGVLGFLGRARGRMAVAAVVGLVGLVLLQRREARRAEVRATRATITDASRAVAAYRDDHGGACPRSMTDLVGGRYVRDLPHDAWGHPLRLVCPGRRDPTGYDVVSDGPDGELGGLDRVE